VGLFGAKSKKDADKMKTFEVKLAGKKPMGRAKKPQSKAKPLSFGEWIDQYVKGSKGNVV